MSEAFFVGQTVYASVTGKGWFPATITAATPDGKFEITDSATGAKSSGLTAQALHGVVPGGFNPDDPDLFRVNDLHASTLLLCLKARYESKTAQYSKMGEMVLSVNPFQRLAINGEGERERYIRAPDAAALDPHVWQVSDRAYKRIVASRLGNQSVVISGESGSGKTENTKAMIAYLGALSKQHSVNEMQQAIVRQVNERLAESNPILESFGNAKTVRNDNSSRFGKYVKLFFDPTSGIMIGGGMETYLLEKSRVVRVGPGERAYHVFYEMLAGLTDDEKRRLGGLKSPADYPSLARGGTLTRHGVDGRELNDADEFQVLTSAMEKLGIGREMQWAIWTVLAAVLHLLEATFAKDGDGKAAVGNEAPLLTACGLLGVDAEALKPCFLIKSKTKILTTKCLPAEAEMLRDSFCKALYVGVFDMLVTIVNKAIAPSVSTANAHYIGILDIFGFENFKTNSFEQLCINFANESLQNHYNKYTFVNDEAECREEGIAFPPVEFPDNTECLTMFDQARTGIFALLDEASYFKGGTHETFTENVWQAWTGKSASFIRPKSTRPDAFGVRHYACDVSYTTAEWLEKNSDPLKEEAKIALSQTKVAEPTGRDVIGHLLDAADCQPSDGQARKRISVSTRFRQQLSALRAELERTETHFVRCIKPNMEAQPGRLDNAHVSMQLESAGVLQTISVKRQGYPARREIGAFARFFHTIAPAAQMKSLLAAKDYAGACNRILGLYTRVFGWTEPHFAVGRTKVFLKAHIWGALERTLLRRNRMRMRRCVPLLSAWARRYRARKEEEARRAREAAVHEQRSNVDIGGDKFVWFEDLCRLFPRMDPTIVYDVVGHMPNKQGAARALSEMRAAQFDQHVPANMAAMLERAKVQPDVVKTLMSNGVDNLEKLYELTPERMQQFGLTPAQQAHVTEVIVQQSSLAVRNQCLLASGTGGLPEVSDEQLERLASAEAESKTVRERVHELAGIMGCNPVVAAKALQAANGNQSVAASMIMDGTISESSAAAAPPQAAAASSPPQPARTGGGPPAHPPPPPPAAATGGSPGSGGGVLPASRPPPQRPPPPTTRPRGASLPSADAAPAPGAGGAGGHVPLPRVPPEWQASLNRLVNEMGFDEQASIAALRQHNGDFRAAAGHLAGAF